MKQPTKNSRLFRAAVLFLHGFLCWTSPALSSVEGSPEPRKCDDAAVIAGKRHGVPPAVMLALNRTETGRVRNGKFEPWPWTVNLEGKGTWFDDPTSAIGYVARSLEAGKRSFDVGCFQLNYRWHGQHFASVTQMFDPVANADYAARFLKDLYIEKGNWADAAAAYHSRTPSYADRYRTRFERILARLDPDLATKMPAPAPRAAAPGSVRVASPSQNRFPLLFGLSDATARHGSLFPSQTTAPAKSMLRAPNWNK